MKKTRLDKYGNISELLSGRGKYKNLSILEVFALQGHKTAWELTKAVFHTRENREPSYRETKSYSSTIYKTLVKLKGYEYVAQCGSVRHSTHKKETLPLYGLTTKGYMVVMVVSEKARRDWREWARNAKDDMAKNYPDSTDCLKVLSLLIKHGASQRMFLKFFVDPNERLVTSTYNMDTVSGETFWNACLEKMILTFEEGKVQPLKNLPEKDRTILMKIYRDPIVLKIRKYYLDFLEQHYSEKILQVETLRKRVSKVNNP